MCRHCVLGDSLSEDHVDRRRRIGVIFNKWLSYACSCPNRLPLKLLSTFVCDCRIVNMNVFNRMRGRRTSDSSDEKSNNMVTPPNGRAVHSFQLSS